MVEISSRRAAQQPCDVGTRQTTMIAKPSLLSIGIKLLYLEYGGGWGYIRSCASERLLLDRTQACCVLNRSWKTAVVTLNDRWGYCTSTVVAGIASLAGEGYRSP